MPFNCVGYNCDYEQGSCEYSFHRFPENRREAWEAAIRREGWKSTEYSRLCSAVSVRKSDGCMFEAAKVQSWIFSPFSTFSNTLSGTTLKQAVGPGRPLALVL